jgi:hypothetical protein
MQLHSLAGLAVVALLSCVTLIGADQADPSLILSQGFVRNGDPEVRNSHACVDHCHHHNIILGLLKFGKYAAPLRYHVTMTLLCNISHLVLLVSSSFVIVALDRTIS